MSIGAAAVYVDDVRDEFVSEFMNGIFNYCLTERDFDCPNFKFILELILKCPKVGHGSNQMPSTKINIYLEHLLLGLVFSYCNAFDVLQSNW